MSTSGTDQWLAKLTSTICKLGRAGFEETLFELVNLAVVVDHCTVFITTPDGHTEHLFTQSRLDEDTCNRLARAYVSDYRARDPQLPPMAEDGAPPESDQLTVLGRADTAGYPEDYRQQFFGKSGLIDKVSSLLQTSAYNIYCSFYRLEQSGPFSEEDFQELSQLLPLLTNLIFKHSRLTQFRDKPADPIITRVPLSRSPDLMNRLLEEQSEVFGQLTEREREVCVRIIQGYTSEAIALDLDVAISTIHTYRKRAYAKLGISSQNELFSLILEQMPMGA
ncbi:helix-turn-helix transcriptional regulator [Emcibacter sp.]|uniref:helix-turn-helix transcriptional regulator n=1 Tax=Emcibacter sp. TaxID=1979954 RepID=UPI003A953ACC